VSALAEAEKNKAANRTNGSVFFIGLRSPRTQLDRIVPRR